MSSVTDRLCTCVFLLWRQLLGCSALICMHMLNAAHCRYWDGRLLWIFAVCCTECICRDKWSVRTRQGHRRLPHICTNCCNSLYLCIVNWKDRFIFLHGVVANSILVSVAVDWHVILEVVSLLRHAAMVLHVVVIYSPEMRLCDAVACEILFPLGSDDTVVIHTRHYVYSQLLL